MLRKMMRSQWPARWPPLIPRRLRSSSRVWWIKDLQDVTGYGWTTSLHPLAVLLIHADSELQESLCQAHLTQGKSKGKGGCGVLYIRNQCMIIQHLEAYSLCFLMCGDCVTVWNSKIQWILNSGRVCTLWIQSCDLLFISERQTQCRNTPLCAIHHLSRKKYIFGFEEKRASSYLCIWKMISLSSLCLLQTVAAVHVFTATVGMPCWSRTQRKIIIKG